MLYEAEFKRIILSSPHLCSFGTLYRCNLEHFDHSFYSIQAYSSVLSYIQAYYIILLLCIIQAYYIIQAYFKRIQAYYLIITSFVQLWNALSVQPRTFLITLFRTCGLLSALPIQLLEQNWQLRVSPLPVLQSSPELKNTKLFRIGQIV